MNTEEGKLQNQEQEPKAKRGRKRSAKQFKVGITEKGFEALNKFLIQANQTSRKKVCAPEVLEQAVSKLTETDIPAIQERLYSPSDKLEILLEQINSQRPDQPLTRDDLLISMVESFKEKGRVRQIRLPLQEKG